MNVGAFWRITAMLITFQDLSKLKGLVILTLASTHCDESERMNRPRKDSSSPFSEDLANSDK